jgi:hypothetical protein
MFRRILVLAAAALAGCATYTERSNPDTAAGAAIGAAVGTGSGGAIGALVGAAIEKPTPVAAVVRVRPKDLMAKLGIGPKSKFAPAYESWLKGIGVPLQAVEELTIVWAGEETRSVHVVASTDVDRKAVEKACRGLSLQFLTARSFACSRGFNPPLDERIRKQLASVGKHDVVVWADASLVAEMDGLPGMVKHGFRDGTLAIDLGDEVEASARLNFKDEAAADKGARAANALVKMARMFVLQMTAQFDVIEVFPEAVDGSNRDEVKALKVYFVLMKNIEPALLACKAVPRGTTVPLYVRADLSAKKLGDLAAMMDDKGSIKCEEPSPGIFFSPTVTQRKAEVARPTPPTARIPVPAEPLPPPAPSLPRVARVPAPVEPTVLTPPTSPTAPLPPDAPPRPTVTPPPAGPVGYNATPTVPSLPPRPDVPPVTPPPAPALPPRALGTMTVANVMKEEVSVYAVNAGGLQFLKTVPAGEAADISVLPGQKLAATFRHFPHCSNFAAAGGGEVWLLRPAPGVSPSTTYSPAACAPCVPTVTSR